MLRTLSVFLVASSISWPCQAASCDDYPNTPGINTEFVDGGVKIIATGTAPVSFDDHSAIADARDEATLLAKAEISKFLAEGIRSDQTLNRAVQETKSMQGRHQGERPEGGRRTAETNIIIVSGAAKRRRAARGMLH
ncbi:hypothetical protein ACU4GR_25760 [Methylobacterium oryzae CBMB20]